VDPSSVTANPGDSFTVNINVADVSGLYGWQFKLGFDSKILYANDVTEGPFLDQGGNAFLAKTIDNFQGYVDVACAFLGIGFPVSGSGVLATINFSVLDTGESSLALYDTTLLDSSIPPQNIGHSTIDGFFYTTLPVASFSYTPDSYGRPIVGEDVTFDASASYDPDGGSIDSYEWDFGDNVTGTGMIATHAYDAPGDYTVTLNVTDNEAETSNITDLIKIKFHDIAILDVTVDPQEVMVDDLTQIYVNVTNNGSHQDTFNVTVYYFDFDDGLYHFIATYNRTIIDLRPGDEETLGGEDPWASWDYRKSNLIWNTTGVAPGLYPIWAYAYLVDPFRAGIPSQFRPGEEENTTNNVRLGAPVNVTLREIMRDINVTDVTVTPSNVKVGQTVKVNVQITNEGNVDETFSVNVYNGTLGLESDLIETQNVTLPAGDEKTLHFSWFVANDTTAVQNIYNISAQVPPITGENITTNNTFENVTGTIWLLPVANFTFSPSQPVLGQTATFDASASYAPGVPTKNINSYVWDFGDGTQINKTDPTIAHVYSASGRYSVTLTVVDSDGLSDAFSKAVPVQKLNSTITVSASVTTVPVGPNGTVITGSISPVRVGANVFIYYVQSGEETWGSLANVTTDDNGQYSYIWIPWLKPETYEVKANWTGDANTLSAESSVIAVDVIQKIVSIIDISVSSTTVMIGESITIDGSISPVHAGVDVTISYMSGGSDWSTLTTVTTDEEARYVYNWEPEKSGTYVLRASWPGDETTDADESDVQTVVVEEISQLDIFLYSTVALAIAFAATVIYFLFLKKPKPAT